MVGFLFNDFLLFVKPKLFFARAAAPTDLEPFGRNEFQMYRRVSELFVVLINECKQRLIVYASPITCHLTL